MVKKRTSYLQRKQKETVNKKAIIWAGSVILGLIVVLSILVIINN